ncbi:uncharacterized protein LOC116251198 [Nymphaea colorata]|uniref:Uncharacterized protein n=1 Tax=Nymphaea colorata TaxID=210225 RepID=A0A5K1BZ01_9MAGN|nr:uncharacterized protein LOC116251198 [Nymphaea colorata]
MNTRCVSGCLQDVEAPIRVSFMKLYQWPHSDAEFLKLISAREEKSTGGNPRASWKGRESYASRQMYLRSYTFCRKEETVAEKTRKWLSEKKKMKGRKEKRKGGPMEVVAVVKRVKDKSVSGVYSVFEVVFECLFSCMARVDVVEFK